MSNFDLNLKEILSYLSEGKFVPADVLPSSTTIIESDVLIKAINNGYQLEYDSLLDELYVILEDGEKISCPDLSEGLSTSVNWVSDYLPPVSFDIEQGGNLRKSAEAESCFKLLCLALVVSDFRIEVIDHFKNYDFDRMASMNDFKFSSFRSHLQKFQDLNSIRINSIISAASVKLSNYKEKNESYYIGLLSPEEISKLSSLSRVVRSIISKYEREDGLNPTSMAGMSKISKLTLIDRRDSEIESFVEDSDVSVLYKISKLTSERIPPVMKARVIQEAAKAAEIECSKRKLSDFEAADLKQNVKRIVIKESYRAILKTIKYNEIQRYKNDPSNFVLKTKS